MTSKQISHGKAHPINLHTFQNDFFRKAIEQHTLAYYNHFGERLLSIYVWGSVPRNEAIPGISDIDQHVFLHDTFADSDQEWWEQTDKKLKEAFPKTNGLSKPRPIDDFSNGLKPDADEFTRIRTESFIMRFHYDATLIFGQDLIKRFNVTIPKPVGHIQTHRQLIRHAAGLEPTNTTDHRLPNDPPLRLRKLARIGVFSGAEFLKTQGLFHSYKGTDVLPILESSLPEWTPFLKRTRELYIHPTNPTDGDISDYLSNLLDWMDWLNKKLETQ